ncbi:SDR family NAD(P)-dependent oxidoreductase, partial [Ralstonia pseudosolanacearum]
APELAAADLLHALRERIDPAFLPRPPRIARAEAVRQLEPALLSFMSESRRLRSVRLARELRLALRYPTVADFLAGGG